MNNQNYKPTIWTRESILKINRRDPNTILPRFSANFPRMHNDVFVWDTMPLRSLDGTIVSFNGWSVIFTLSAPRQPYLTDQYGYYDEKADWQSRHMRASICYWYSRTGKDWIFGGVVMDEDACPTQCQWAGTPILLNEQGDIDLYYTCVSPGTRIGKVSGQIYADKNGVFMEGFSKTQILLEADGQLYQNEQQNPNFIFRDPSPFIDPIDGQLYMLFEGNVAGDLGSHQVTQAEIGNVTNRHIVGQDAPLKTGCIGIAKAKDPNGDEWELLPPLVTAVGVNNETERPHLIFKNKKYYLFTISHTHTFAGGITGPDGLYGFVSDNLFGPYTPMNRSGLVLGNPISQPYQCYSHYVMPGGLVTSFIEEIPYSWSYRKRIGGTEAPTVQITLNNTESKIVRVLGHGYIPANFNIKFNARGRVLCPIKDYHTDRPVFKQHAFF